VYVLKNSPNLSLEIAENSGQSIDPLHTCGRYATGSCRQLQPVVVVLVVVVGKLEQIVTPVFTQVWVVFE
jgi:hypothetical protein